MKSTLKHLKQNKPAFSMIEIMVVTSIIVLLMLIAIPAFVNVTGEANIIKCNGNIKKMISVFQAYSYDNSGLLPKTGMFNDSPEPEGDTYEGRYAQPTDEYLASLSIWRGDVANSIFLDYFDTPEKILRDDDPDVAIDPSGDHATRYEQLRRFVNIFFCPTSFDPTAQDLPQRWYGITGLASQSQEIVVTPWRDDLTPDPIVDPNNITNLNYYPRETTYFSTVTGHLNPRTADPSVYVSVPHDWDEVKEYNRGVSMLGGRPGSVLIQDRAIGTNGKWISNHNDENIFLSSQPPEGLNVGYLDGSVEWLPWLTDETFKAVSTTQQGIVYLAENK